MPGTKDEQAPSQWFKKAFGFREQGFEETKRLFSFADDILRVNDSDRSFYVGPFDTLSLEELQARLASDEGVAKTILKESGALTFHNIRGSSLALHLASENAGAVFQVASLFNCLELDGVDQSPADGVTKGGSQPTQGSACASACPAATLFRNYFVNGVGQAGGQQVDCLAKVSEVVDNRRNRYWSVRNGFCMPTRDFKTINKRFQQDIAFEDDIRNNVQVGIHWDTDVAGGSHRVAQVFCSAAPVSLSKFVKAEDWEAFARCVLEAEFEATLTAAACLARQRGERVRVFLTPVGGGMLGNRVKWIAAAIDRALKKFQASPLDVHLVHLNFHNGQPPVPIYKGLEQGRWTPPKKAARTISQDVKRISMQMDEIQDAEEHAIIETMETENARRIAKAFAFFDLNGDGVIDRREFMDVLSMLDSYFFNVATVDRLLEQADADGDGEVHYVEFAAWLAGAHCDAVVRNLFAASLAKTTSQDFEVTAVAGGPQNDELYIEPRIEEPRRKSATPEKRTRTSNAKAALSGIDQRPSKI